MADQFPTDPISIRIWAYERLAGALFPPGEITPDTAGRIYGRTLLTHRSGEFLARASQLARFISLGSVDPLAIDNPAESLSHDGSTSLKIPPAALPLSDEIDLRGAAGGGTATRRAFDGLEG
jgi:hypothetical protein